MAKLVQCDICSKNVNEDNSYELKLRKSDTGLTKSADVCHDCIKEKGFLDILANRAWKKWNQTSKKWVTPE